MNVLVTGGYGFVGSHVVEMLLDLGHRVAVIDNISTGDKDNVNQKHAFFQLGVEDPECEEVFRNAKFDAVIHLAAQVSVSRSVDDPYSDSRTNVLGLVNMLHLSHVHKVKKFIFASSAAVYGEGDGVPLTEDARLDPKSPYGLSKLAGELYCTKWNRLYGLNTVVFRFSNIYGPRQGSSGEGGVISIFMGEALEQKELVIFGDGSQTRDFIFVKDVALAICRAVASNVTGVFNLSSNTESSVSELAAIMGKLHPVKGTQHRIPREGDIKKSCLDNTKIKEALEWTPTVTLEEGLRSTFEWYQDRQRKKRSDRKEASGRIAGKSSRTFFRLTASVWAPYIENLVMFALAYLLTVGRPGGLVGGLRPDFMIVYVVLVGIVHGLRQSALSSILACVSLSRFDLGTDVASFLGDANFLLQASFYIVVGVVVGYVVDTKNGQLKEREGAVLDWTRKYDAAKTLNDQTRAERDELH